MRTSRAIHVVLVLSVISAASACFGQAAKAPTSQPATAPDFKLTPGPEADPKATVLKAIRAIEANNKEVYLSCRVIESQNQLLCAAMFDRLVAWYEFQRPFLKTYGNNALSKIKHSCSECPPEPTSAHAQAATTVKITGNSAVAKVAPMVPGQYREGIKTGEFELVKKDGLWKLTEFIPPMDARAREKYIQGQQDHIKTLRAAQAQIGQPGMTAEKIGQSLGEAMTRIERSEAP
jgi:hypothetical protein